MKKIVVFACLSCLLSCNSWQGGRTLSGISVLPSFDMLLLDSTTLLNTQQIPLGKPVLILYFRPDCPHCQQETKEFLSHIDALKDFRIYFLAGASFEDIKGYSQHFHLDQYQNITVGKDHGHSFTRVFRPASIPYLAIYDSDKRLVKIYDEEVPVDKVIKSVHS